MEGGEKPISSALEVIAAIEGQGSEGLVVTQSGHRDVKTLQKFAAFHASIHNHFNQDRHLNRRDIFKQNRAAALAEWRQLSA